MSSGVGHLGKDKDTMGRKILEPRAQSVLDEEDHQPVLGEEEHQPVLGEEEHQSVLDEEEPQLVVEEPHEPDEDEPKRVSVAPKRISTNVCPELLRISSASN